jgi:hypothetical protein
MSGEFIVEIEESERSTSFRITPAVAVGQLIGLPRPKLYGSEGPDTIDFQGVWAKEVDMDSSLVAFESSAFGSHSSYQAPEQYARDVIGHLQAGAGPR